MYIEFFFTVDLLADLSNDAQISQTKEVHLDQTQLLKMFHGVLCGIHIRFDLGDRYNFF